MRCISNKKFTLILIIFGLMMPSFTHAEIPAACIKSYQSKNIIPQTKSCLRLSYLTGMCGKYRKEYCGVSCDAHLEEYQETEKQIVRSMISAQEQQVLKGIATDTLQGMVDSAIAMKIPIGEMIIPASDLVTTANEGTARAYAELYTSQLKALPAPLRQGFTELMIDGLTGLQGDVNRRTHKTHKEQFLKRNKELGCGEITLPEYEEAK